MSAKTRTMLVLVVASGFIHGLCGCQPARQPWQYVPSEQQVTDWIARRQFVIEVVHDVAEPMPGTIFHGHPQKLPTLDDRGVQAIREDIQMMGGRAEIDYSGVAFDVTVSDELVAEGIAASRLHDHYARRLADAGWHITSAGSSGIVPGRKWYAGIWTDLPGSHHRAGNSLSMETAMYGPATARRGFFVVRIAVILDEVSNKAHVMIDYSGKIGKPAASF